MTSKDAIKETYIKFNHKKSILKQFNVKRGRKDYVYPFTAISIFAIFDILGVIITLSLIALLLRGNLGYIINTLGRLFPFLRNNHAHQPVKEVKKAESRHIIQP